MATRTRVSKEPNFWEENRSLVSGGLVILIILALGFLAFDTLTRNKDQNNSKTQNSTQKKDDSSKNNSSNSDKDKSSNSNNSQQKGSQPVVAQSLPATHVVIKGESLWKLAVKYYNDGYKWTVIASENKLANPNILYTGTKLTIPKLAASTPAASTALPTSYTVVKGDSLWNIAMKYYGNGYQWYKIRDANSGKVGKLANGRPLIRPGSVLTIPK